MMKTDISVIVPVYNTKVNYLKECINSILNQSLSSIELILVSDGATSELINVMESYLTDSRVSLYLQENQGVSAARNLGIKKAKGSFLTFVDSDDFLDKDTCLKALNRIKRDNLTVLLWGSYKFDQTKKTKYMPYCEDITLFEGNERDKLLLKTMAGTLPIYNYPATKYGSGSACSKLYKRDFLLDNDLFFPLGIKRAEDVNFHIRVFDKADRIGYLNENLYYYRQNSDSATYIYRENGIEIFTDALNYLWEFVKDKDDTFKEVFYMRCIFFLLESMDMDYLNKNNKKKFLIRAKEYKEAMKAEPYNSAIKKMSGEYLSLAKKIPYFLIKYRQSLLLMLFYKIYKLI